MKVWRGVVSGAVALMVCLSAVPAGANDYSTPWVPGIQDVMNLVYCLVGLGECAGLQPGLDTVDTTASSAACDWELATWNGEACVPLVDITSDNEAVIADAMPTCDWTTEVYGGPSSECICAEDAVVRDCQGVCGGGDLSCAGCDGVLNSGSVLDDCGSCDADPTNDCTQDCEGAWGGDATVDGCGTCDNDSGNDCTQDCAGIWGGAALDDACGVCGGDNSCLEPCERAESSGVVVGGNFTSLALNGINTGSGEFDGGTSSGPVEGDFVVVADEVYVINTSSCESEADVFFVPVEPCTQFGVYMTDGFGPTEMVNTGNAGFLGMSASFFAAYEQALACVEDAGACSVGYGQAQIVDVFGNDFVTASPMSPEEEGATATGEAFAVVGNVVVALPEGLCEANSPSSCDTVAVSVVPPYAAATHALYLSGGGFMDLDVYVFGSYAAADACAEVVDVCPDDAQKTLPGLCGCGMSDVDSDGDGVADCEDECPSDGALWVAGPCECGVLTVDTDGDGSADCVDGCPDDADKQVAGSCGCGVPELDTDGDGIADCTDACVWGDFEADEDHDDDGVPSCEDGCFKDATRWEASDYGDCVCEGGRTIDHSGKVMDLFLAGGCRVIMGNLKVQGTSGVDSEMLMALSNLEEVAGFVFVWGVHSLTHLDGLSNLVSVGGKLEIKNNDDLYDLSGLFGLVSVGGNLIVKNNDALCVSTVDTLVAHLGPEQELGSLSGNGGSALDSDGDGTPDCDDECLLGDSSPDADGDGDGLFDCAETCTDDPGKGEPGVCGCGVPDTDSDGDGVVDCEEACADDPEKVAAGVCGCGVSDVDSDGDGWADCVDQCPGSVDMDDDTDGDGMADCADTCILGEYPWAQDSDGDGLGDCLDSCPEDVGKVMPGSCGCGTADTDTDGDGFADCVDECSDDVDKNAPGQCGCGVSDVDSDGDGVPDCFDACPEDAEKESVGTCGCGVPDVDTDADGTFDCVDACLLGDFPLDDDSDGDGSFDCVDPCRDDADKTEPGVCGCGTADDDSDGDGTLDCLDACPDAAGKTTPGQCGCAVADVDSDLDGEVDCMDGCPLDSGKTAAGLCGCGVADADTDGDGVEDCVLQSGGVLLEVFAMGCEQGGGEWTGSACAAADDYEDLMVCLNDGGITETQCKAIDENLGMPTVEWDDVIGVCQSCVIGPGGWYCAHIPLCD